MLRFYGQPKFRVMQADALPIGYELFIREKQNNQWTLPEDFNACSADQIYQLLTQTIAALPANIELISFNLEQGQFIKTEFVDMVARVQAATPIKIFTELTERSDARVSAAELKQAARQFHERGLLVCIDDVGTGDNTPQLVYELDPYIDEYKFALQNFRPFNRICEISDTIGGWYELANNRHKMLAIEGLENKEDLESVQQNYPCDVIQGYYTGKPALLPVSEVTPSNFID